MSDLAYERAGSGPPLVLLHPLGADRRVWAPVLERLAVERDCVAVDLPGFGQSPPLEGEAQPRALATALLRLLDQLGLGDGRAHLAGNSLGGWVALEAALQAGAASVTAIAPAGLWPRALPPKPELARRLVRAGRPALSRLLASAAMRRAILGGSMAHPERMSPEQAAALLVSYADAPGFTAVNRAMRAGTFRRLAEIEVPVTLVWPERDRLVTRPRRLPENVRQVELPGCGHIPMWDDPAEVSRVLLDGSAGHRAAVAA